MPKQLTEDMRKKQIDNTNEIQDRYRRKGGQFLHNIVIVGSPLLSRRKTSLNGIQIPKITHRTKVLRHKIQLVN